MPELQPTCHVCGKRPRALLYCHQANCGFRNPLAAVDLPRPTVDVVTTEDGKEHVVVSRDGKGKSYEIEGVSPAEKVKSAVTKVIGDAHTAEWLPR